MRVQRNNIYKVFLEVFSLFIDFVTHNLDIPSMRNTIYSFISERRYSFLIQAIEKSVDIKTLTKYLNNILTF